MLRTLKRVGLSSLVAASLFRATVAVAAEPSAEQALELAPVQKDVIYQKPAKDEAAKCTVESVKEKGASGWIVRDPSGLILRRFLDTNQDNKLDLWCYFRDGIEVIQVPANHAA